MPVEEFGYVKDSGAIDLEELERRSTTRPTAVIVPIAQLFGVIDDVEAAAEIAPPPRRAGWWSVVTKPENELAGGIRTSPGRHDAEDRAGELQSFAISPSYGGPYAGIIASGKSSSAQMPGRLVGQTGGSHGNRAFCMTLSTRRAAHPPREATSNIDPTRISLP